MPIIQLWEWPKNDSTIVSTSVVSSAIHINATSSAISFGNATFQSNITVGTFNNYMAHADGQTASENEIQQMHNFHWKGGAGNDTAFVLDQADSSTGYGAFQQAGGATPKPWRGLGFRLVHATTAVQTTPVTAWCGTGANVDKDVVNCKIKIADLTLATSLTKKWGLHTVSGTPGKLVCSAHTVASKEHYWTFAISLTPTDVGFSAANRIKLEATYF